MGFHGRGAVDDGWLDRGDAGALGFVVAGREDRDAGVVHAKAGRGVGRSFPGRVAGRRAAQDGVDARRGCRGSRALATAGHPWPWSVGCRWACATLSANMLSRSSVTEDEVLVIDETGFLKQGKASCGVARQYRALPGRSRTARSVSSRHMYLGVATRSSTGHSIFRKHGPMIRPAWRQRMCRTVRPLRRSRRSLWR